MTREEGRNLLRNSKPKDNNAHSLMLNEALEMAINALEQEPCDKCEVGNPCMYCKHEFELKTGRWIAMKALNMCTIGYLCSECKLIVATKKQCTPFCPYCGAKMEIEPEERS